MTVGGGTLERWRSEKTAAYLATAVAAAESDPGNAALFRNMAGAAEKQAGILAKDLGRTPDFSPALRARLIAKCIAAFGPRAMRPVLSASKVRGVSIYDGKTEAPAGPSLAEIRRGCRQAASQLRRRHAAGRRVRRE